MADTDSTRSRRRRRAAAAALTWCVAAALGAGTPALAARNLTGVPESLAETATSQDFAVHYTTAPGDPDAIAPEAAQSVLVNAERALGDSGSRLDLPAPLDDGDGRADVYVYAGAARPPEPGLVRADSAGDRTSGWIGLPPAATGDIVAITHEVVHLQQLALYRPAGRVLAEGSATWAPLTLYAAEIGGLPDSAEFFPEDPVDCADAARCSRPGYGAWRFVELLSERYGPDVVRRLYDRSQALGARDHRSHLVEALDAVLAERATTLPAAFGDFTAANLTGAYSLAGLAGRRYAATEPSGDLATGNRTRTLRPRGVTLDHLSAAFYRLRSGRDDPSSARTTCRRGRLRVRIDGPADLEQPLHWAPFRPHRGKARPLALVTGRATLDLPWSTCSGREIGVAFANPSTSTDDRAFRVTARIVVRR